MSSCLRPKIGSGSPKIHRISSCLRLNIGLSAGAPEFIHDDASSELFSDGLQVKDIEEWMELDPI